MKTSYLLLITTISGTIVLFLLSSSSQFNMYEKQVSKEECMGGPYCPGSSPMPSASLGNRTAIVSLKLYSNSTMPSNIHYLWLRFFDKNTNQTIPHVTFSLNITKDSNSLLFDTFNAPAGMITLQVNANNIPFNGTVLGDREAVLGGWMPHTNTKPVVVYAPVFDDDAKYHVNVRLFTVDSDNNMFNPGTYPQFDSQISMSNPNQLITMNPSTIPEFPLAIPILLIGITSLIVFYRVKLEVRK